MGAASLQGSLLLMAFIIHTVLTAPVIDDNTALLGPDQIAEGNGCYYNYEHYEEGDRILTNEPCLNCTCHNRMLMCYLRVCPFTKAIGQDCKVEKKPDQCCPVITCPQVHVALLTSSTTETASPSTALGHPDNYGCVLDDNTFYADGAQVPSDPKKPCELCYCIRNQTACVMQECTLNVEGCKPVYQEGVCCPVRYDCDYDDISTTTPSGLITTPGGPNECLSNGKVFHDGELIDNLSDKPCEHCYCMRGEVVCAVQDCGTPLENTECTPLEPEPGQCCPSTYQCPNGTVPANALNGKPKPSLDSLSITEKPADEEKEAAETEAPSSGSNVEAAEPQPERDSAPDANTAESVEVTSEGDKEQAVIEIITTAAPSQDVPEEPSPSEQLQEHKPEEVQEASRDPEPVEQDHVQEAHPEHGDVQPGQDAEATTATDHYTEISVENVEMNTSPPAITKPEQPTQDAQPSENTAEPEAQEPITSTPYLSGAHSLDDADQTHHESESPEAPSVPQEPIAPIVQDVQETTQQPTTTSTTEAQPEPEEMARIPGEGSCLHLGITYAPNTEVPSANSCKRCRCVNSIVTCSDVECPEPPISLYTNCVPMPPTDDACCPTYFCEQKPSAEPEAENQMSIDKIDQEVHEDAFAAESITTVAPVHEQETSDTAPENPVSESHDDKPTDAQPEEAQPAETKPESDVSAGLAEAETQAPVESTPPQVNAEPSQPLVESEPSHDDKPTDAQPEEAHPAETEPAQLPEESRPAHIPGESEASHTPEAVAEPHAPEQTEVVQTPEESSSALPESHQESQAPADLTTVPPEAASDGEPISETQPAEPAEPEASDVEKDHTEEHEAESAPVEEPAPTTPAAEVSQDEKQDEIPAGGHALDEEIKPTTVAEAEPLPTESPKQPSSEPETPVTSDNTHPDGSDAAPEAETLAPESGNDHGQPTEQPMKAESDAVASEETHDGIAPAVESIQNENGEITETTAAPVHDDQSVAAGEHEHQAPSGPAAEDAAQPEQTQVHEDESATSDGSNVSAEVGTEPSVVTASQNEGAERDSVPSESSQLHESGPAQDVSESDANESENASPSPEMVTTSPELATSVPEHATSVPEHATSVPEQAASGPQSATSSQSNQDVPQTERPIDASESPEEPQPMVTTGPPVLFPDIGHQGAPIQIPGPAGISESGDDKPLAGNDERFGETEAPVTEVQTEGPKSEESSAVTDANQASENPQTHEGISITTEGPSAIPSEHEKTNELISTGSEADNGDNQISESSQTNEANEVLPESVPSPPETISHESPEAVPSAPEAVPSAPEDVPSAPEAVPSATEAAPSATEAAPSAPEAVPSAPEAIPSAPEAVPSAPEAVPSAPEAVPSPGDVHSAPEGSTDVSPTESQPIDTVTESIHPTPEEAVQSHDDTETPEAPEKIIPPATEGEAQAESQTEQAPAAPIVTHGELPSPAETAQEPVENAAHSLGESEQEKQTESNEPQSQPEIVPPSAPDAASQPGPDAVTHAPENDEVVTHIDSAGPPKVPEIANQVVEADINAIEHSTAEEGHPIENEVVENEKTVPAAEDRPVAPEETILPEPVVPELPVESQPNHIEPEHIPEESPAVTGDVSEDHGEEHPESVPSGPSGEQHLEEPTPDAQPEKPEPTQELPKPEEDQEILQTTRQPESITEKQPEQTDIAQPSGPEQGSEQPAPEVTSQDEVKPEEPAEQIPAEQLPEHQVDHVLEEHDEQVPEKPTENVEQVVGEHVPEVPSEHVEIPTEHPGQVPEHEPVEQHAEASHPDVTSPDQQGETTPLPETEAAPETPQVDQAEAAPEKPQVDQAEAAPEHHESSSTYLVGQHSLLDGEGEASPESTQSPNEPNVTEGSSEAQPIPSDESPTSPAQSEVTEQSERQPVESDNAEVGEVATAVPAEASPQTDAPLVVPESQPVDSESQPSGSEAAVSPSGESVPTAGDGIPVESAPSAPTAPESAPSAPEAIPEQPSAPEVAPEQPSAPDASSEAPLEHPTAPETVAEPEQPSAPEQPFGPEPSSPGDDEPIPPEGHLPTQPESSHTETEKEQPVPESPSSQLTELAHSSQAPPVEVPTTEGPAMAPGLQNWSQKPAYPQTHPEVPHLPEDSHYPSPPYDQDYEDEDSISYGPGTCRYGGKVYLSAQQIPRDDPCDFCFCFRSDIICLQQSCPPPIKGCYQETIKGFCCPRYECHVSMATMVNITTTSTTTTTTVPPHFLSHHYNGSAMKAGCQVKGIAYRVGDRIPSTSGPCLDCRCGADGQMKCDPTNCGPQESLLRQVMAASVAKRRRR